MYKSFHIFFTKHANKNVIPKINKKFIFLSLNGLLSDV